jgi:hypothetical protein
VYRSEPHSGQCRYAAATSLTAMLSAISGSEPDDGRQLPRGAMPNAEIPRRAADRGTRQV